MATSAAGLTGVPVDGYPNYAERAALVAINRARSDPNDVALHTASACSNRVPARPPLMLSVEGSRAARFHSQSSILNDTGLSHDSYCTLRDDIAATGCDGAASCACVPMSECFSCTTLGGCGTNFAARAGYFGFAANGEVGAAGQFDAFSAVEAWVTECPPADGHRRILTGENIDVIGLGYAGGQSGCWSPFWFGDTGYQAIAPAVLPSGVHVPESGSSVDFYVNYFSPNSPVSEIFVVVDGQCRPMNLHAGTSTNGVHHLQLSVGSGCHEYWFLARDAGGAAHTYPEAGAYGAGDCSAYSATRMENTCGGMGLCVMGQRRSCGVGRCAGMQTCDAAGSWGACDGPAPLAREMCNGEDDDCDGVLPDDERDGDRDQTRACAGDCNDLEAAVHPGAAELCNESDDDCDLTDDEGCPCANEGEERSCGSNLGICTLGTQRCTAAIWSECAGATQPIEEICINDVDEDCDGTKDDGCPGLDAGPAFDLGPDPFDDSGSAGDAEVVQPADDAGVDPIGPIAGARGEIEAGCGCTATSSRGDARAWAWMWFAAAALLSRAVSRRR